MCSSNYETNLFCPVLDFSPNTTNHPTYPRKEAQARAPHDTQTRHSPYNTSGDVVFVQNNQYVVEARLDVKEMAIFELMKGVVFDRSIEECDHLFVKRETIYDLAKNMNSFFWEFVFQKRRK